MVRHGTHGRSTAARPPHPLTHKKTRLPRTPTCSPRPHPFPEKPPRLCPAPKNCRRRTFVAPQNPRRRAAPARGPRTVVYLHRPNRNAPQQARPLLVGRVRRRPGAEGTGWRHCRPRRRAAPARGPRTVACHHRPTETHRSLSAPCSWGRQASPRSQRHWLAAPPPHPSPQKPQQAAGPCSWACRRLPTPPPQPKRTAAGPPPARGAGQASPRSRRHWPAALPPTAGLTREGRSRYNRDSRMMWEVLPHVCSGRPGQSGP